MSRLQFQLQREATGSKARATTFRTLHGVVKTPVFMPVGTQATVRTQTIDSLKAAGSSVLLANTYHLLQRPGPEVFRKFGGIHRFMNWDGPVLTDSGGFQIFSLPGHREMTEDGARFTSLITGREILLSPEESIAMQRAIGSDIMMVLDQCIPSTSGREEAIAAMELTHRWAKRSLDARGDSPQALFGIVQGACFKDLREKSADTLTKFPFDGFAIGGLAVGETKSERDEFAGFTAALLPCDLPRYLMGVGTPIDLLEAVHRGVDMFDCILPTSISQRGSAFTSHGKLQLRRTAYRLAEEKLDSDCACPTCQTYSRAYLHHLIKCDELLGWQLLATHNLYFYHRLMREMRESILVDRFLAYYEAKRPILLQGDEDYPVTPPKRSRKRSMRWRKLGDYELHDSPQGFTNIRQISSGEIMHSVSDPAEEANRLYIEQSRLADRLKDSANTDPLVIWDVGLGAASNAMAAIQCFERVLTTHGSVRPMRLISFECDLDPLRLAAKHGERFAHLRHSAPHALLESGRWTHPSGLLTWELLHGDFLELFESTAAAGLIFYDPFSYKTDSKLWTPEVFRKIFQHCQTTATELYTYSASTAVRVALLSAGFYVARGTGTGPKSETSIGLTPLALAVASAPLLGEEWLQRWSRSDAKFPPALPAEEQAAFENSLRRHPQFEAISHALYRTIP